MIKVIILALSFWSASASAQGLRNCSPSDALCVGQVVLDELSYLSGQPEINDLSERMALRCLSSDAKCVGQILLRGLQMVNYGHQPGPINPPKAGVFCMKAGNSRFYPHDIETGKVVGGTDYNAGHSDMDSCKKTLPKPDDVLACFKYGNSRYYPTSPDNWKLVGSGDYNAGHSTHEECYETVPSYGQDLTCFKWGNGRYYPTRTSDWKVFGSTDYNAGYSNVRACRGSLPN